MTLDARILVVDDVEDNRFTLLRRLRREGYNRLLEAADGEAALDSMLRNGCDLVLLDIMMPGIDGVGVLERMKRDPELEHIPVIMISAVSELESVVRCVELGAEDYLQKPFNPTLLRARISASLERKLLRDRERAHLQEIDRERRRVDELLRAILPASAVEELRTTSRIGARRFDNVTVLMGDVVGFTSFCEAHSAEEVVARLDRLAQELEDITAAFGLEKIKMIGDAFIATGNLLQPNDAAEAAAVDAALAIAESARAGTDGWAIRIGIHVGPVVAGIVGRTKFTYDLWGDTVNVAARLSCLGSETAIFLSELAYSRVADRYDAEPLGRVGLRGRSDISVYRIACRDRRRPR